MPENKIVDDYYNTQKPDVGSGEEKTQKAKHQIKGKLKLKNKKESEEKTVDNKKTEKTSDFKKPKKVAKKPIVNSFANVDTTKNQSNQTQQLGTFSKDGNSYTTSKNFSKNQDRNNSKDKPNFRDNNQRNSKNNSQSPKENRDNNQNRENRDNNQNRENNQNTQPKFNNQNSSSNFSGGDNSDKKFVKSNFKKKTFSKDSQEDDNKGKKLFKKDRSNKYNRNTYLQAEDDGSFTRSNKIKKIEKKEKNIEDIKQNLTSHAGETIVISDLLSLKELSEKTGVPLMKLMTEFMKNGMKVNINSKIDFDTASIIAEAFDIKLQKDMSAGYDVSDILDGNIQALTKEDDTSVLTDRAPVISIMGHVDHGKTSLLDYIRKSKVADKEAGGITQSIGAYQVEANGKKITFLDTPGHEAFTIMRARGAKSTDIAILVVAADEGVKPQTLESINHAREAGIPVVVAINKMDKEGANPDFVKGQLSENGLVPEDWGGDTPMVPVSAKAGTGIDDLLEIILLVAEMQELKANPNRQAVGTVIESHLDTKLGPVCTVLINTGTLNKGDSIVCKGAYGKVKVLRDYLGKNVSEAAPSVPVLVVGLDSVVEGGDIIQVVSDIEKARIKAVEYKDLMSSKKQAQASSLDLLMSRIKSGSLKQLKIVLKSDTNGSLEALKGALIKLSTPETRVSIIHSGVGNVTEGDVLMCQGSKALLVSYNVDLLGNTKNMIEDNKIELISSKVIYHITEKIEKIITGMLDPKEVEIALGEALVGGIFFDDKDFMILGLKLKEDNKIQKGASVRVIRKDKLVGKGKIDNLKSGIIDVDMLEGPIECGIKFVGDFKVEKGDMLEIFKIEIQK